MDLKQALITRQQELGLSNRAFARLLGVSHVLWIKTLRNDYRMGSKICVGAMKAFPELRETVTQFMTTDLAFEQGYKPEPAEALA